MTSDKCLKLNKFRQEGYAYFENIDFSASDNKDILATMLLDFPRIVFQKCIFKSLIATKQIFNATISFDECKFADEVDFSESIFNKVVSFKNSSFHGKTLFINTVFKSTLEFFNNVIKPNIKGEVSFKVDKAIGESRLCSERNMAKTVRLKSLFPFPACLKYFCMASDLAE